MPALYASLAKDTTGLLPSHLFIGELQKVVGGYTVLIRPNYGSFFKESFILYSVASPTSRTRLIEGTDFVFAHLDTDATALTGKEVYNAAIVTNTLLPSLYQIDYQAFGGDSNFNLAQIGEAVRLSKIGIASDYSYVVNAPERFTPEEHTQDIADVYGFDTFSVFMDGIKDACVFNKNGNSNKLLTDRIAAFGKATKNAKLAVAAGVREHLDLIAFYHNYTKADLNLGNVSNFGFIGNPLVTYASPATLLNQITNAAPPDVRMHASVTNNPHGLTAQQIGLSEVVNLPVLVNYSPLTSSAAILFAENATEVYFTPFTATSAVREGAALKYTQAFGALIDSTVTASQEIIAQAVAKTTSFSAQQTQTTLIANRLQQQRATIELATSRAVQANRKYRLLYENSDLSETLKVLAALEYANANAGFPTYPNGFFDKLPTHVNNLVCWLSVNQPKNHLFTDIAGNVRLTKLVDLSDNGYEFSSVTPSSAPIYGPGYDKLNGLTGIVASEVIQFNPGQYLDQTKGAPLYLKPGMTLIALTRSASIGTQMSLLSNPMISEPTSWTVQTTDGRSVSVRSGSQWKPLIAPIGSAAYSSSGISVASISATAEADCWLATTVGINRTLYPRGVNTPASQWPSRDFTGAQLSRIGNDNHGIRNQGELVDLLVYDRQLSFAEVKVIAYYLKLRASKNTALSVDFSAANAFI